LLEAAEAAGFDVLVTTDRDIRYSQNLTKRKLAVIVLSKASRALIRRQSGGGGDQNRLTRSQEPADSASTEQPADACGPRIAESRQAVD
jgi:hypothetical protein